MKYTQEEIKEAIEGHIVRFNKWIDELSQKHEAELRQVLSEAFEETIKRMDKGELK